MPFVPAYDGQFPSLGYGVIDHVERYLGIELMREQAERLIRLFRIDLRGRRVVRRAGLRRPKGCGKSPEGAYIGFGEFSGPVIFDRWAKNGQPVGRRHPNPWVQFAAVSEDQTDNVSVWLYDILADRKDALAELHIDLGRTRIYFTDGPGRIETVTAASGSREGQPLTFGALDQTEAWMKNNGGLRLASTMRRNAAKTGGWTYELQNSPGENDGSVAAETQKAWDRGQAGLLFDTREPSVVPALDDRPALVAALREVYGESAERGYVSVDRLADECVDPSTLPSDAYRFYLNIPWAGEELWAGANLWDSRRREVNPIPGEEITAGFVGRAYQGAALVGCRMGDAELFVLGAWESDGERMVPRLDVGDAVDRMMAGYTVRRFYVNPQDWGTEYDAWALAWGEEVVITRPPQQTTRTAVATDRLRVDLAAGDVHHDGNEVLRRHAITAHTRTVAAGTLIVPRTDGSADQITAARAAVLAYEARADILAEPPPPPKKKVTIW